MRVGGFLRPVINSFTIFWLEHKQVTLSPWPAVWGMGIPLWRESTPFSCIWALIRKWDTVFVFQSLGRHSVLGTWGASRTWYLESSAYLVHGQHPEFIRINLYVVLWEPTVRGTWRANCTWYLLCNAILH